VRECHSGHSTGDLTYGETTGHGVSVTWAHGDGGGIAADTDLGR
jgi:hypothetical protein